MLPTHRVGPRPSAPSGIAFQVHQYGRLLLAGRPLRWLPYLLIIPITLWLVSRLARPPGPEHDEHSVFGRPGRHPRPEHHDAPLRGPPSVWPGRAAKVRNAFIHAYTGYQTYALPYDELLPVKAGKVNNFNAWGLTMFDALDTMWIMGLDDYFHEAVGHISETSFALKENEYAPFFETVIRYLGGLLSAYALSGEPILLARADDLGRMLLPAFDTPSGFPAFAVNTLTGHTKGGWTGLTLWAEALSNQMEYKYLAHLTGRKDYYLKVEKIMQTMYTANVTNGMFPTMWDGQTGIPKNTQFSVGAFADSAHEYLLKQWLLTGKSEPKIRDLYLKTSNAILDNLFYVSPNRELLYVTDTEHNMPTHTFEHLSCFLPGLLALGAHTLELTPHDRERHEWAAKGLAYTCWSSYADQASGLGPDEMSMRHLAGPQGKWVMLVDEWEKQGRPGGIPPGLKEYEPERNSSQRDYTWRKSTYLLRPETVESFYILWRTTGDERWRERGWSVFEAIERHAKTEFGYTSLMDVDTIPPPLKDEMPSYFMAETLKYLYLLFTDEELIPLDKWVFNTEAHPLPIFEWKDWEKAAYNLTTPTAPP